MFASLLKKSVPVAEIVGTPDGKYDGDDSDDVTSESPVGAYGAGVDESWGEIVLASL